MFQALNEGGHVTLGFCQFTSLGCKPSRVTGQTRTGP